MDDARTKTMQTLGKAMEKLGQAIEAQKYAEFLVHYTTVFLTGSPLKYDAQALARALRSSTDNLFAHFNEAWDEAKAAGASPEILDELKQLAAKRDSLALLGGFQRELWFVRMMARTRV